MIVVAVVATCGFATGSTALILLATLLALPTGVVTLVGYYLAYGLLALVPGANPSTATGSWSCTADNVCHGTSAGELATWFAVTTTLLGILAPIVAATINVVLLRLVSRRRHGRRPVDDDSRPAAPAS